MTPISVVLTSCGRHDLLDQTIVSFNNTNTYPIDEFIIINDSGKDEDFDYLRKKYTPNFKIIHNNKQLGQLKTIDKAYDFANNFYIFHLEDDWLFEEKNYYIENSLSILDNNYDIHQVWLRHEYDNPHKCKTEEIDLDGVKAFEVERNYQDVWNGFSFNPGLRRKTDYNTMFPNGYSEFADEKECAIQSAKFDYKVIRLKNTTCRHLGYGRSTSN